MLIFFSPYLLCENDKHPTFAWLILGDPGAASWDDKMLVVKAYEGLNK